MSAGLENVSL